MSQASRNLAAGLAYSVQPIDRRVRVRYGSFTLVDTNEAKLFHEGGNRAVVFVPRKHLPVEFLHDGGRVGAPRSGQPVRYWDFSVGVQTAENGAWSFEQPQGELAVLAGYVAFDTTQVTLEVNGGDDEVTSATPDASRTARRAGVRRK